MSDQAIIDHLTHVRQRPGMFIGGETAAALRTYLYGFNTACSLIGYTYEENRFDSVYWKVCAKRGWEVNALGAEKHMRNAAWSEEAIIDELLVIEIEAWQWPVSSDGQDQPQQ